MEQIIIILEGGAINNPETGVKKLGQDFQQLNKTYRVLFIADVSSGNFCFEL